MQGTTRNGRRLAALAAALAAVALAAGCGSDSGGGSGSGGGGSGGGGGGSGKQYAMTLIPGVKGDEFYISMRCGAQQEAQKLGVKLDFQGPDEFSADQQTPIVNAVAARKPDAILVAPTDSKAMYAPLLQASRAGSKIVLVDTTLDKRDFAASSIASDNLEGGREAGRELLELIGGRGKVLVVNVNPGISTTDQRQQGFEQAVKGQPGVTYLGTQFSNDEPAKAASIVTATLAKHPDLKGIFATNLFSAEGAASGLRQAGKLGQVKIVGFDAGPKQVQDLKQGLVQALVVQKPLEIGRLGVQQAYAALEGKSTRSTISTGFVVATKRNLSNPEISRYLYKSSCG